MRGQPDPQRRIYYALDIEVWIPEGHPLRGVKARADQVLASMRGEFEGAYAATGRPGVPPEMLLKALLLQALYSIRSERQLVEQIRMNLLYRWFLDLSLDAEVWDATTFTKNRERFARHGLLRTFFERVGKGAYLKRWASEEDFSVDGTLIESCASLKSLGPLDSGAERVEAVRLVRRARRRHGLRIRTLAPDKGYDAGSFLHALEGEEGVVPLVPTRRGPIRDRGPWGEARPRARRRARTVRYRVAQRRRKRTEEISGWVKTVGGLRRSRHVGRWKIEQQLLVVAAAYNLLRMVRLEAWAGAGP